jgi:hypothetical protein
MGDWTEADHILATALIADAIHHEAGRYRSLGDRYDEVEGELLPIQDLKERRFAIAFNFWDGWIDASNHNWYNYPGIAERDWPRLARHVAETLEYGDEPTDPLVLQHFAPENLVYTPPRWWQWLSRLWRRPA